MKEKITKEVKTEIEKKRKLPKELKLKRNKKIFTNLAFDISITLYFIFLNLGYINIVKSVYVNDVKVFSGIILVIALIIFEKAFKNGNGKLAIHGIEILILSVISLFIPYIYFIREQYTVIIMVTLIAIYNIYYLAKSIVIAIKTKIEYNNSLSDVKKIIKKEDRKVVEVSDEELEQEIVKEKNENTTGDKKDIENKKENQTILFSDIPKSIKRLKKNKKEELAKEEKTKRTRKTAKQEENIDKAKETIKEEKPKRTRKTAKQEENIDKVEEIVKEEKPKRTRKTVKQEESIDKVEEIVKEEKPKRTRKTAKHEENTDKVEEIVKEETPKRTRKTTQTKANELNSLDKEKQPKRTRKSAIKQE